MLDGLAHWQLVDATSEERDEVRDAVKAAMDAMAVGTSRDRLKRAAEAALKPFNEEVEARKEEAEATRQAEATADKYLQLVEAYLRAEYEFASEYELCQTAREVYQNIKPKLVRSS